MSTSPSSMNASRPSRGSSKTSGSASNASRPANSHSNPAANGNQRPAGKFSPGASSSLGSPQVRSPNLSSAPGSSPPSSVPPIALSSGSHLTRPSDRQHPAGAWPVRGWCSATFLPRLGHTTAGTLCPCDDPCPPRIAHSPPEPSGLYPLTGELAERDLFRPIALAPLSGIPVPP